jgi:CheY-like chemotaxis protein
MNHQINNVGNMATSQCQKKIIYAEDDPDDQYTFREIIREVDAAIQVVIMDNGLKLLNYLQAADANQHMPCCIVLDINMPICDGIATLEKLRQNNLYEHVPIIMFTSSINGRDVLRSKNLGANDFIAKPNRTIEFNAVAMRFVNACHNH